MRRSPFILVALLLAACTQAPALPSGQVMEKAVLASQEMQSAAFTADFDIETGAKAEAMTAKGNLQGRLQEGGKDLAFTLTLNLATEDATQPMSLSLKADMVVLAEGKTYLRVGSISGDDPMFSNPFMTGLFNQWWILPMTGSGSANTPDPRLLQMQTEVLTVTDEAGTDTINGRTAYHYNVTVDKEKLLAFLEEVARQRGQAAQTAEWQKSIDALTFDGEVWIDAETFYLLRADWNIVSTDVAKPMNVDLKIMLSDHNNTEPISPPTDVSPFPSSLQQLLMVVPGAVDQMPSGTDNELPPEMQEEILRSLLESR